MELNINQKLDYLIFHINLIEEIIKDLTFEEFSKNRTKQLTIERLLIIVGGLVKSLENNIGADHNIKIDYWNELKSIIIKDYYKLDYHLIFQISTNDIVLLKNEIFRIKNKLENK